MEPPIFDALPRGRHHLTREQVVNSQRMRLLLGMAEVVAEKGYCQTSVAEVLRRVHVSRETFYENFADKQACFLAAFDEAARLLMEAVSEAVGSPDLPAMQRIGQGLHAYLTHMADEPALAKTFLLEAHAAGPVAARRRYEAQSDFIDMLNEMLLTDPRWRALPDPRLACGVLVGGIGALVAAKVAAGEHAALPALHTPILTTIQAFLTGPVLPSS